MNNDIGLFNSNKVAKEQFKQLTQIAPDLSGKLNMYQANKAQNQHEKFSIFDQHNNINTAIVNNNLDRSFTRYNSEYGQEPPVDVHP